MVFWGCASTPPPKPLPAGWSPSLGQVVPGDVDLVARIDLSRARQDGVDGAVRKGLADSGLSSAVLSTLSGCLDTAARVRIALRFGPNGTDGDVLAVVAGVPKRTDVPCNASGWKYAGTRRDLEVFEPEVPSSDRSAGALMMRSDRGEVLVATPGQVDSVLRVLRDGPDADRLDPKADDVVVLAANVHEELLPEAWKQKAPTFVQMARGLLRVEIRAGMHAERGGSVRAELVYGDARDAGRAGETLKRVRDALAGSDGPVLRKIGESSHATLQGEVLRVEFALEAGSVAPEP